MIRRVRPLAAVVVLAAACTVGARRIGPAPALGPLLDPAHGVWALARTSALPGEATARVRSLGAETRVLYDDRAVPHIFAATEEDAYRALGYVVARDRLAQLWLQTMAASGRLTELGGARALPLDREMRGLGLPRAAERAAAQLGDTGRTARLVRAYADGVNSRIAELPRGELPLEFRLAGARPPVWTPTDAFHLFNRMGWTLAHLDVELERAAAAARVGTAAARALFPDGSLVQQPIQPGGDPLPRVIATRFPAPGARDSASALVAAAGEAFLPATRLTRARADEPWSMASNNWAVSPRRSASGHALLAGDPHLELTLPSIWYEVHLVVPGRLDVYGVTIPGAPGVVIGFNRDVSWTFTNSGIDVLDYWAETVDDTLRPSHYRLDGAWRPVEQELAEYRDAGGKVIAADTLRFTHRGPLQRVRGRWLSMRWTVLEAGRELSAFHDAAHATSAQGLEEAMARSYMAPAQNMLAADRGGHIAIRTTGRFPIRAGDGDGAVVRDGTTTASDWRGALPVSRYPQAMDPAQGFLASANQEPIDPSLTNDWWGGRYDPWRAMRINALLRADSAVTVDAMRRYQTDPGSARADWFVPRFLEAARRVTARGGASVSTAAIADGARLLAEWNRRYTRDNRRAVLFEGAMRELAERTWDELLAEPASSNRRVATPSTDVLAALMLDSASVWWDDTRTPRRESRDDVLAEALGSAFQAARQRYGDPAGDRWRWDRIRFANVRHVMGLAPLSVRDVSVQGGTSTLSPSSGTGNFGASWRMVVEMGPEVRAWATYPGGQSGNPMSARYRDRMTEWAEGRLSPVRFPRSAAELPAAQVTSSLVLRSAR